MPPVQDIRLLPIVGNSHVYFSQVDTGYLVADGNSLRRFLLVGRNDFVLGACPVDHHGLGQFPRPIKNKRGIAFSVREGEPSILQTDGRALVLNPEVVAASPWRMCIRVALAPFPPTVEAGKERLHGGISGMSMQFVGRMPAHQVRRLQPDALLAHRTPKRGDGLRVEAST